MIVMRLPVVPIRKKWVNPGGGVVVHKGETAHQKQKIKEKEEKYPLWAVFDYWVLLGSRHVFLCGVICW